MILTNEYCQVIIEKDTQYSLFSTDNKAYDYTCFLEDYTPNDFFSAYSISITADFGCYTVAVIGRAFGSIENCAVLEKEMLVVLVDNYLVFYNVSERQFVNKIKVIDLGTGLEIYPFDSGYVINSEVDIIKVNKLGKKEWTFSGRDIWVNLNGERPMKIIDDKLYLQDFNGYQYCVNKNGKEIPICT